MIKPICFYKAITEAIDAFGDRHYINARSHLAQAIGLKGSNAGIQLSNILNYKSYNPANPKPMKLGQLAVIFDELDQVDVMHILNGFGSLKGLVTAPKQKMKTSSKKEMGTTADAAMEANNNTFNFTKEALRADTLNEEELKEIIKSISEAQVLNARLKMIAEYRLECMEEEG